MPTGKPIRGEIAEFIITQLAWYRSPIEILDLVKEQFGEEVTKQQLQHYNPDSYHGKTLKIKYVELFRARRQSFLNDVSDIPIANVNVRLRRLENTWIQLTAKKNYIAANAVLEQAAKEASGFYTNRKFLSPNLEADSFVGWLKGLGTSSLPIVYDVDIIENTPQQKQLTESESILNSVPKETVKPKDIIAPKWKSKWLNLV